ncbi:MAG: intradiol ring-cleavage dioxygenase [Pontibacterium sp.]
MKKPISRRNFTKALCLLPVSSTFILSGCGADSNDVKLANPSTNQPLPLKGKMPSGGTDLITVDFPTDKIFDSGNTCPVVLTDRTTEGPCYFEDDSGEDISEGQKGLPMQLCIRIVDEDCQPLAGYQVEVWHCDTNGVYSGDTSMSNNANRFADRFCTGNNSDASQSTWFRGKLTTEENGRVNFKTCFPGWYRGRTIHIHFTIKTQSGRQALTSQLCFTDDLPAHICTTHPLYKARGVQDRPLASGRDNVFLSSGYEQFIMSVKQNTDGTLLAYHTIQVA